MDSAAAKIAPRQAPSTQPRAQTSQVQTRHMSFIGSAFVELTLLSCKAGYVQYESRVRASLKIPEAWFRCGAACFDLLEPMPSWSSADWCFDSAHSVGRSVAGREGKDRARGWIFVSTPRGWWSDLFESAFHFFSAALWFFDFKLLRPFIQSCFSPQQVLHWVNSGPQIKTSTFIIISRKYEQKSVGSLGAQAHYQCVCARHATVNLVLIYIRKTQELGVSLGCGWFRCVVFSFVQAFCVFQRCGTCAGTCSTGHQRGRRVSTAEL